MSAVASKVLGSTLTPAPIVALMVMLRRYVPFADAGFALSSAASSARALSSSLIGSNDFLPIGTWTMPPSFSARNSILPPFASRTALLTSNVTVPVFVMLAIALVIWYVLGHTALGRRVYATGLSEVPAKLAGIRTDRIRFCSLILSATISGIAGILLTAIVSAGDPTVGPSYLIPAFAAAFLGATQFRDRLFNAWGTVLAVWLLGTITAGLALTNAPVWMPYIFQGVVLIVALSMGSWRGRSIRLRWPLRPVPPGHEGEAPDPSGAAGLAQDTAGI